MPRRPPRTSNRRTEHRDGKAESTLRGAADPARRQDEPLDEELPEQLASPRARAAAPGDDRIHG